MAYYKRSNILEKGHVIGIVKVHVGCGNVYVDVRNSLLTRSSLDGGVKAWVLKAEVHGKDDESDKEGDGDGLDRQCCEVLSIP